VAQHFIELISSFRARRMILFRWFGQQAYNAADRQQKRSMGLRKGIMLDEHVD